MQRPYQILDGDYLFLAGLWAEVTARLQHLRAVLSYITADLRWVRYAPVTLILIATSSCRFRPLVLDALYLTHP